MGSSVSRVQPPTVRRNTNVSRAPNSVNSSNVAASVYNQNQDPVNPNVNRNNPVNPNGRPRGASLYNEYMNGNPTTGGRRKGKKSRKNKKSKK